MIRGGMTVLQTDSSLTVFDLEFTAWDGSMAGHWLRPGEFKEVVQIGAVRLDAHFNIVAEFDCLVRPRVNPRLSDYFQTLTGITDRQLDARGVDFTDAYERFLRFADGGAIAAFGHDDWVLQDNVRLYGLVDTAPLPAFTDLRDWFAERGFDPGALQSCHIGPRLGVPFQGRAHNALDDARSLAMGMGAIAARSVADRPAA